MKEKSQNRILWKYCFGQEGIGKMFEMLCDGLQTVFMVCSGRPSNTIRIIHDISYQEKYKGPRFKSLGCDTVWCVTCQDKSSCEYGKVCENCWEVRSEDYLPSDSDSSHQILGTVINQNGFISYTIINTSLQFCSYEKKLMTTIKISHCISTLMNAFFCILLS